jgi:hypothetical protein
MEKGDKDGRMRSRKRMARWGEQDKDSRMRIRIRMEG